MALPEEPRSALFLIGQLSAPMQAVWVFAQIVQWSDVHFYGSSDVCPERAVAALQLELVAQRDDAWVVPPMCQAANLQVVTADGLLEVQLCNCWGQPVSAIC